MAKDINDGINCRNYKGLLWLRRCYDAMANDINMMVLMMVLMIVDHG